MRSLCRSLLVVGLALLFHVELFAQTVRSNATQFPSIHVESAGSSSVPSITFVGDTATGLSLVATGYLGFSGTFVPAFNATYDIGSTSRKIRNLFLSGALSTASVAFGDGSAGSPSITFTNAATKGLYLFDSTTIGVSGFLGAGSDAAYDIGLAASRRFRNGFFSGLVAGAKIQVGAGAPTTSNVTLRSSDAAGRLSVMLGDESGPADVAGRWLYSGAGIQLAPVSAQPTCSVTYRGSFWLVAGAAGIADQLQVCSKSSDDAYYWLTVF